MGNYLTSTRTAEKHVHVKPTRKPSNEKGRPSIKLEDLPEDVLCTILAKLPAKEVVRTSILSSEWRCIWTTCPKLSFNGIDVCRRGGKQHTQMFIDRVNAVLQKHHGKAQWMLGSPHMFSQLRHVQILLIIYHEDNDKILYIVSFLRVAPSIEKLEVHFHGSYTLWFANSGPFRQEIPPCEYTHLKNIHVTGFRGARGQVEFLEHVVENAPSIEVVTVNTAQRLTDVSCPDEINQHSTVLPFI